MFDHQVANMQFKPLALGLSTFGQKATHILTLGIFA